MRRRQQDTITSIAQASSPTAKQARKEHQELDTLNPLSLSIQAWTT